MATNPYIHLGLGLRWVVTEPTAFDLLNIARVHADVNRWTLEQLVVDPDTTPFALQNVAGVTLTGNITMPDNGWIGLGAAKGRIEFDDQATDEVNFLDCNVGIGTATPAQLLEVEKDQNGHTVLQIDNNTIGTAACSQLKISGDSVTLKHEAFSSGYTSSGSAIADGVRIQAGSDASGGMAFVNRHSTSDMTFWTNDTQRVTIDGATGNVGIGTVSPTEKLEVAGAGLFTGNLTAHATGLKISYEGSGISQLRAYGADATTQGTFLFKGTASDGSPTTDFLSISGSSGNVIFDLMATGNRIVFDTDGDSSIRCSLDDIINLEVAGSDVFQMDGRASGITSKAGMSMNNVATTLSDSSGAQYLATTMGAVTVTLAGTTQVTTLNQGMGFKVAAITVNQSGGAVTMDQASALHVPVVTAGTSVTITANRMISTGVSDCYLTVGGVWTDTVSTRKHKTEIVDLDFEKMPDLIRSIRPRQYRYGEHFDDFARDRYGAVAEEFPDFLRVPGDASNSSVNGSVLANFSLMGIAYLLEKIEDLETEVAELKLRKAA